MMTRAHIRPPPTEVPPETTEPAVRLPVKPNPRRRRQMVQLSILYMERQIVALEGKGVLTESHRQTAMRISKILESMSNEFQMHHYEIVDTTESDEGAAQEQEVLDEHQKNYWSSLID